jgi:aldehyde dehydrogenase (NAD+)
MGPLIDEGAVADYEKAIEAAKKQGGKVLYGGKVLEPPFGARTFVQPTIIELATRPRSSSTRPSRPSCT